jgi:hypothetical protein
VELIQLVETHRQQWQSPSKHPLSAQRQQHFLAQQIESKHHQACPQHVPVLSPAQRKTHLLLLQKFKK